MSKGGKDVICQHCKGRGTRGIEIPLFDNLEQVEEIKFVSMEPYLGSDKPGYAVEDVKEMTLGFRRILRDHSHATVYYTLLEYFKGRNEPSL